MDNTLLAYQQDFIELALDCHVLQFGEFELKSSRISPYFFNAGKFSTGSALARLGRCYAAALHDAELAFDMLFGPAYKGIPLVASTAMSLADHHGQDVSFAFNRKEAKIHGEGGSIVGAALCGDVVVVDDVMTAGTAIRESMGILEQAEARGQQVDEDADAALKAAVEAQIEAESLPMFLSGRLYDDGVIDPRDTRTVLGMCLSAIANAPIEGTSNFGVFRM